MWVNPATHMWELDICAQTLKGIVGDRRVGGDLPRQITERGRGGTIIPGMLLPTPPGMDRGYLCCEYMPCKDEHMVQP